jgi:TldD protein
MPNLNTAVSAALTAMILAWAATAGAQQSAIDPVLVAMAAELERATADLAAADPAPYYLALEVTESRTVSIAGEEGGLQGYAPTHKRWVDVDIRIGDPALDSTHTLRGSGQQRPQKRGRALALGSSPDVIQRGLWREIDRRFLEAQERWAKVQSEAQTLVDEEPAEDLAAIEPVQELMPLPTFDVDLAAWEDAIRRASTELGASEVIHDGSVSFSGGVETRWFVSSEGTRLRHVIALYRVSIRVDTVADDGEQLQLTRYWDAFDPASLPDADMLVEQAREVEQALVAMRTAPD